MTDLFDAAESKAARDAGMARVEDHAEDWMYGARLAIMKIPHGWVGTGEDIRLLLTDLGMGPPHHHNTWGALIGWAVRDHLLEWTGGMSNMRSVRSHARVTKVYRRV